MARAEQRGDSVLNRRVHRKISVRDDFQARLELVTFSGSGPVVTNQAAFICGRPEILDRPLRVKVSAAEFCAKAERRGTVQREIQKHFVGDDGQLARHANFIQFFQLVRFGEMPGGIIGMHNDHSAGARGDGLLQSVKINLPAVIVVERITHQLYILNIGEEREERIAGLGDQDFIAWIAERAEDEGIGLAGAGGEDDALSRHFGGARFGVVCGNCPSSDQQSPRLRVVR